MTELLVRHLAVIGLAGLLSVALRNRSAALRHALWVLALSICLLLPFLQQVPLELPSHLLAPTGADRMGLPDPESAAIQHIAVAADGAAGKSWATLALTIHLAVALALLFRWLIGLLKACRLARLGERVGSVRGIPVIAVDGIGPLTFGWPRSVIIVPHAGLARNDLVLRHELAHVRRADFLWQAVGTLACAMWWFSPAIWFAQRALRREAEQACDDQVLAGGADAADYANCLLEVSALKSKVPPNPVLLPLARESGLARRIAAALAPARDRRTARLFHIAALALVLLPSATFVSRSLAAGEAGQLATLAGRRIVVDPGHGGADPGAAFDDLRESDISLAIAKRARVLLEQAGARVELTREGNEFVSLRQRASGAADLLLSVHVGADTHEQRDGRPMPVQVIYHRGGGSAAEAGALKLARAVASQAGAADETGRGGTISAANFLVLREAKAPAFLVNFGLMNSEEDRNRLRDPQVLDALAMGLVNGAAAVLGSAQ